MPGPGSARPVAAYSRRVPSVRPRSSRPPTTDVAAPPARSTAALVGLAVGVVLVAVAVVLGLRLRFDGVRLYLGSGLLAGSWDPRLPAAVLVPLVVAGGLVAAAGRLGALPWRRLLLVAPLATAAWAVSLAAVDGRDGLLRGVTSWHDYLADVPRVGGLGEFLGGYVERVPVEAADAWTTHVGGHPPGPLLLLVVLDRLGLGGPSWAAVVFVAAGGSAVAAVLVATRAVAGEEQARAAAPFLVLAPAVVWLATSADALFLGVSAWGLAALAVAATVEGRRSDLYAVGGGLLLGVTLFLSYGLVLLGPLALAVVVVRRRLRPLVVGGLGVLAVVAAFATAGFWWVSGLLATMARVAEGPAATSRPTWFFLLANLAVVAIAIGPAAVAGLGSAIAAVRARTRAVLLPLTALGGVLMADVSLLSKGEVERIYLPFHLWLLTATVLLATRHRTGWLVAQVVTAFAVQLLMRTSW